MSVFDLIILGSSSQQPTRERNHGAYLFRWNEEGLLFDPGEGTQRQFIFANVAPTAVTRLFVSHFHGDHCLGVGSMIMRLNLDKVTHPLNCYFPKSGKKYFERLRYGTIYHETIDVIEHPLSLSDTIQEDEKFIIESAPLDHGIDNLGYRVTEKDRLKFNKEKLKELGIVGPMVKELQKEGEILSNGRKVKLEEVSWIKKGESIAVISDTRLCDNAIKLARGAKVLLCESTYLESEKELAAKHYHLTAKEAASIAKEAGAEKLILTHFSARYPDSSLFEREARAFFPNTFAAEDLRVFDLR